MEEVTGGWRKLMRSLINRICQTSRAKEARQMRLTGKLHAWGRSVGKV
jgi:hypothetical protein